MYSMLVPSNNIFAKGERATLGCSFVVDPGVSLGAVLKLLEGFSLRPIDRSIVAHYLAIPSGFRSAFRSSKLLCSLCEVL